jgi:hypothetical protein
VNPDQLTVLIAAAGAYLFMALLLLVRKPKSIKLVRGAEVLRYGWLLRGPAIACCFLPAVIVVLGFVTRAKGEDVYAVVALIALAAILVSLLILEVFTVRLVVSHEGIHFDSPWRGHRFFRWDDVLEVRYERANFRIHHIDGGGRWASLMFNNIGALVRAFHSFLPKVRYENAYEGIEWVEKYRM